MKVGVIVGRFQVPDLHSAHISLINHASDLCDRVVIFVGGNLEVKNSQRNPLTYEMRRDMIKGAFPDVEVYYLPDHPSDQTWDETLDNFIEELTDGEQIRLFGGRDSFLDHYQGRYGGQKFRLEHWADACGTDLREATAKVHVNSVDFRAGVIWGIYNRYPATYPTVDVAIFNCRYDRLLLGRKEYESQWRLIGGFADPGSGTYEEDAAREAFEEANVKLDAVRYLSSAKIDDWRYARDVDVIKSLLFAGQTHDAGVAGDDIHEVKWFPLTALQRSLKEHVMPAHRYFVNLAVGYGQAMSFEPGDC